MRCYKCYACYWHRDKFASNVVYGGMLMNLVFRGAVVAQWIRSRSLNREVPGSNLLAVAVVSLGEALYPHCLVP